MEKELPRHRPLAHWHLCSPTYDIFTFIAATAAPLLDITGGDWISICKLAAVPSPPAKLW
jgi:hypothetical protein